MKRAFVYSIIAVIVIIGVIIAFSNNSILNSSQGECSQYSNKDGYTGCMSIVNGKEKKCKFKVENKVNKATQKMEFTYTCLQK